MVFWNIDELTGKTGKRCPLLSAGSFSGPVESFCDESVDGEQVEKFADEIGWAQDVELRQGDVAKLVVTEVIALTATMEARGDEGEVVVMAAPHLELELESVNALHYRGKVGDRIYIKISKRVRVERVAVIIYKSDGDGAAGVFKEVERGDAVHMVERGWEYTASTNTRSRRSRETAIVMVVVNELADRVLGDRMESWVRKYVVP